MKKAKYIPSALLIIINLISICLIINLSRYDELTVYLQAGEIGYSNPKKIAWVLFFTMTFNLFFACVTLMKDIMLPYNSKNR